MRNRPDSRPRLAGLRADVAGSAPAVDPQPAPWPLRSDPISDDDGEPVGWTPPPAGPDERQGQSGRRPEQADASRRTRRPARRQLARLAKRWVPESLQESRVDPGKRGALLLTVIAAVAALAAAVGVWWDRPEPRPVQSVSLSQVSDGPTPSTGHSSPARSAAHSTSGSIAGLARVVSAGSATKSAGAAVIVVSVTGAVRRPGLVRLSSGSRVADAIDKAGGATAQADLTGLNLAQKLSDGASVVVSDGARTTDGSRSSVSGSGSGSDAAAPAESGSDSPKGKVDLNTADVAALDALPGVGPVTAASIVAWREKNGRFSSVEQLQEIQGIGPAKYASLAPLVTV